MPNPNSKTQALQKKALLIEEDPKYRSALTHTLQTIGLTVISATQIQEAKELIIQNKVDLILSNFQMPDGNALELLAFVKAHLPARFILLTAFSNLIEPDKALSMGADGLLCKPFQQSELIALLHSLFPSPQKASTAGASPQTGVSPESMIGASAIENEFCKVSLDDFIAGRPIPFDFYVRMNFGNYTKLGEKGEYLSPERIKFYKKSNIRYVHLRKEAFRKNFGFSVFEEIPPSQINQKKKDAFLKHTSELISTLLYRRQINEHIFDYSKNIVETSIALLYESEPTQTLLEKISHHTEYLYPHSLAVALMSMMLAKELNWTSTTNQFKIAVSALFHDLGETQIAPEVLRKKAMDRTHEENILWQRHPARGAQMLAFCESLPTDIVEIITQHHEGYGGYGFPRQLKKSSIHPLARLIIAADRFSELNLISPIGEELDARTAIQKLESDSSQSLDPQMIETLKKLFNL